MPYALIVLGHDRRTIIHFDVTQNPTQVWLSRQMTEAKGQEDLDVPLKMQRLRQWCKDVNRVQSDVKYDFVYVDEESFGKYKPTSFQQLVIGFGEYKK